MPRRISTVLLLLAVSILLSARGTAFADPIVVPSSLAATEGDGANGFPFNLNAFQATSMRYQQVYNASMFGRQQPLLITAIAFRPDVNFGQGEAFSSVISSIQLNLSTTVRAADGLSTRFADNVGANDRVVFSGALALSSAFSGPVGGPKAFDIVIRLATPFLYNPRQGNLLLDVRNFSGERTTQFDASESFTDGTSRMLSRLNGVNNETGFMDPEGDSLGLVMLFEATPTPEPTTMLLTAPAIAALLRMKRPARAANPVDGCVPVAV